MKIEVLSAIELVRSRPSMFFDNGVPTNARLLSAVHLNSSFQCFDCRCTNASRDPRTQRMGGEC